MNTQELFQSAQALAKQHKHEYVQTDHLMYVLCTDPSVSDSIAKLFVDCKIDVKQFIKTINKSFTDESLFPLSPDPKQEPEATIAFNNYFQTVKKMIMMHRLPAGGGQISIYNLLTELLFVEGTVADAALEEQQVSVDDLLLHIESQQHEEQFSNPTAVDDTDAGPGPMSPLMGPPGEKPLPKGGYLAAYCDDLSEKAKSGELTKLIGRTKELADIAQVLSRKKKNNAILVGPPGVGKTCIAEGLALLIKQNKVPLALKDKVIVSLNIGSLIAGAKFRGDFEKRVDGLVKDLGPQHILLIDEIHLMMGAGGGSDSNVDLANMLKPKLNNGTLKVIGTTTHDEYRKTFDKDPALARRFMKIDVKEPTADETVKVLNGMKSQFEKHHRVKYPAGIIKACVELSGNHIHNKFWPDKAVDLLDAAGARKTVPEGKTEDITETDIAFEVARIANVPEDVMIKSEAVRMKDLRPNLAAKVFGQDEAVEKLTNSVLVARAGLRGHGTVQGGYLFVGPSGVGKTEIAKALSTSLGAPLIRFDMSEFSEKHTISRLVGAAPGYVGSSESEGKLIEAVEQHPDGVLLLDEVEKAHPEVFNLFLQILDEGHITSLSTGKTVKMQNMTVIMTTNLGSKQTKVQGMGYTEDKQDDGMDKAVKAYFRPEFLNRLDGIVKFDELSTDTLSDIAKKFVKELNADMKKQKVKLKLGKKAIEWIVAKGTVPGMGARPMKRVIHEHIKIPLAPAMLFGELVDGGTAEFVVKDDKLVLKEEA